MQLRKYIASDCEPLSKLFFQTIHSINAKDYTKEQLDVWATGTVDLKEWDKSFLKHHTIVAIENNEIHLLLHDRSLSIEATVLFKNKQSLEME